MEENGKRNIQKDGVDFLIKQGYKKVSAKTFISDVDLELFLNRDFTNINKTRALGFIQILEREYDVDLRDLKDAYLEHDDAHKPKKPEKLFVEEAIIEKKPWQKYLPIVAGLLAVLGLAYYLFRPTVESIEPIVNPLEENRSIIKQAEKNVEKLEKNESEKSSDSTLESSLNSIKAEEKETKGINGSTSSALSPTDDLDLDKVVLQMMKDRNISSDTKEETNTTAKEGDQNSSTTKVVEKDDANTTKEVAKTKKKIENKTTKKVAKKSNKKLDKLANIPLAKTIPIKKFKKQQGNKEKVTKKAVAGKGLFISPIQKAWVGVIYLDDFTKKDFLIRGKLPLNSNRDQLIVVGHNKFKIYNKTYSVKFRSRGPVRFIYQDGELMEINKKEFMRTSAGVAW